MKNLQSILDQKVILAIKSEKPFGEQAQFDWKEKINLTFKNGEKIIINVGSLILSASKFKVWTIYPSVSLDCVLDFLANSFEIIGGIPKEILIDNATTMMLKARTESNEGIVNPKFQQFADDYGFKVVPCIAGRPNTKSKVENPMRVIDEIMVYNSTKKPFLAYIKRPPNPHGAKGSATY